MNQPRYPVNLSWSDEDACWIADAPDLEPCCAHGDTRAQALANIECAITGWLEVAALQDHAIPPPRHRPAKRAA